MKMDFRKLTASLVAVTTLAVSMVGINANAASGNDYTSQRSWDILVVPEAPALPSQHRTYTCTIPAYSGGYRTNCSSISGSNDRSVKVSSSVMNYSITTTGLSAVYTSSIGGTISVKFEGQGSKIVANGTVGYFL